MILPYGTMHYKDSIICMILRYDTIHCDQPNPLFLLIDPRAPTGLHAGPSFPSTVSLDG
jgi:hypothetical protein